jgi:hypothetical protein
MASERMGNSIERRFVLRHPQRGLGDGWLPLTTGAAITGSLRWSSTTSGTEFCPCRGCAPEDSHFTIKNLKNWIRIFATEVVPAFARFKELLPSPIPSPTPHAIPPRRPRFCDGSLSV